MSALQWDVAAFTWLATAIVVDVMTFGTATPIMIAGAAALGLHAGVIGLYWNDIATNPMGTTKFISVKLDSNIPLVTPPDWIPPALGTSEPLPPDSAAAISVSSLTFSGFAVSVATLAELVPALQALDDAKGFPSIAYIYELIYSSSYGSYIVNITKISTGSPIVRKVTFLCPSGYLVDTSGVCKISNASVVNKPSDGTCEISKLNGIFVPSPKDPDCSTSIILGKGTSVLNVQNGTSSVSLTSEISGGTSVSAYNYDSVSNKTKVVTTGFDSNGSLTDQIQEYFNGQVLTGGTGGTTGATGGSCGGTDQPACKVDLGEIPAAMGVSPDATTSHSATSIFNVFSSNDKLNALKGFSVPAHSSACPQPSFVWRDKTFVISAHCQLFNDHMPIFSGVMSLIWVITGTFIILRA